MKITGIGGVFFRAKDPEALKHWYMKHLGVFGMDANYEPWMQQAGPTVFMPFPADTDYFGSESQQFMINFRVNDLDEMVKQLGADGVKIIKDIDVQEGVGRFAHIEDPEGNHIELWEPSDKNPAVPNPMLEPLSVLVGEWTTIGHHPLMPDVTVHGTSKFEWIEGGAFLCHHSTADHPDFPNGISIYGSDDGSGEIYMLYFDSRKVSRKYEFSIDGKQWKCWRDDPQFSQRVTVEISDDGNTMTSKGEMCRNGSTWEGDLNMTYTRVL